MLFIIKGYTGRPGKWLTSSLDLRTKSSNKKKKARFSITNIIIQDFSKFLKKIKNSPYLGYKSKQAHNAPTEAHFFLINQITKLTKAKGTFNPTLLNRSSTKNKNTPM